MSAEDLEKYETEMELSLYREYKDIVGQFSYVVETERRFYLANSVEMVPRNADGEVYFELLRRHSQSFNIKLADVARLVIESRGQLPSEPTA